MLTQYGRLTGQPHFRCALRSWNNETELSLLLGERTEAEACALNTQLPTGGATVRHVTAGRLREAGFVVVHSPSPGNDQHVSVYPPKGQDDQPLEWEESGRLAALFDACFTGVVPGAEDATDPGDDAVGGGAISG